MSVNSLLKLEFFKSIGFASKENGMEFIKATPKLHKAIQLKVEENNEQTHFLLEDIKDNIFSKFDDKKDIFIIKFKSERGDKLIEKKNIQKSMLKEEMRSELLLEIKQEQESEKSMQLQTKYPKCILNNNTIDIASLNDLFIKVVSGINNNTIDKDEIKTVEKAKEQVEKAILVLIKAQSTLNSLLN